MATHPSPQLKSALTLGLAFWAAGTLALEALAIVGQILTALAVFVLLWPERREWRSAVRGWAPLIGMLVAFLLFPLLGGALPSGTGWARWADWLALPIAAVAVSHVGSKSLRRVFLVVALVWIASCVLALLQHMGWWPGRESLRFLEPWGFNVSRVYEPVPGRHDRFMGGGLAFHRLRFAHVGGLAVLGSAAVALASQGRKRWAVAALTVFGLVAVAVFPHARAAALSLVLALAVVIQRSLPPRQGLLAGAAVVLLGLLLVVASPSARQRLLASVSEQGTGDRATILSLGVGVVRDHPVTGIGLGKFELKRFASADHPQHLQEHPGKAHNQLVTFAAETGIPGALAFIGFLLWLAQRFWRAGRAGAPGLGILAFFVLLGMTHDPLFHTQFSLALMLSLGAAWGFAEETRTRAAHVN